MTSETVTTRASRPDPAPRRRRPLGRTWDRVLMLDVGLVKTEAAGRQLLCNPAGMCVGYVVATLVGLPGILGLLIGAMPSFITCLVIVDTRTWRVAARTAAVIVPFVASIFGSIALHEFRVLELALIVGLLFVQFAAVQWGPWANDAAVVLFAGYLCGLLTPLPETSVLGLAAIAAGSLAATIVIRTVLFRPAPYRSLVFTRRAMLGWGSAVLDAAADALGEEPGRVPGRALRRLRHRLARFQEAALSADGMLAATGTGAEDLHLLLFDTHLAIDGLGRNAEALLAAGAPADVRRVVVEALRLVIDGGGVRGEDAARTLVARFGVTPTATDGGPVIAHLMHRNALQLADLTVAHERWRALRREMPRTGPDVPFRSPVVLVAGRPAGAVPVLDDTLASGGLSGPWSRWHITAAMRTGVQAAVAVAITEPLALLLSGSRFYWGVIGVMIVLAGTNTTHERIRKGLHRGLGTVVGGAVGILGVHLLGTTHPAITIVLVCVLLAVGSYGFGGVYSLWVACLVVVLCQVYEYSGTFTDSLIPLRLAENLLGAAIAIGVSLVVLPVATGTMVRNAVRRQLAAVRSFVLAAGGVDSGTSSIAVVAPSGAASAADPAADPASGPAATLRARSRALDAATYQLDAVMKPMVRFPTGGPAKGDELVRSTLGSVASSARELAARPAPARPAPPAVERLLAEAAGVLTSSIDALSGAVGARHRGAHARDRGDDAWVRPADLLDECERITPDDAGFEWVRDRVHLLGRIDESLAIMAARQGLQVSEARTTGDAPTARARRAAALVERRFASGPAR